MQNVDGIAVSLFVTKTDYYGIRRAAIKKSTGEKENACARGSDQTKDRDIKAQSLYAYICDTNYDSRFICMNKKYQVEISTITKGVPIAKLEFRHQRLPVTKTSVQVNSS